MFPFFNKPESGMKTLIKSAAGQAEGKMLGVRERI